MSSATLFQAQTQNSSLPSVFTWRLTRSSYCKVSEVFVFVHFMFLYMCGVRSIIKQTSALFQQQQVL